jgi:hypothetical protein
MDERIEPNKLYIVKSKLEKSKMMIINQIKRRMGDGMGIIKCYKRINQYSFNCKTYNS